MCAFFVVLAVLLYEGQTVDYLLPAVSGVAMASVRLLPSMNRISSALTRLTYNEPAVDKMIENLTEINADTEKKHTSIAADDAHIGTIENEIKLVDVDYCYPEGKVNVLQGANMDIRVTQSVGIVGTSGSGKTTAVDIMLGLLDHN